MGKRNRADLKTALKQAGRLQTAAIKAEEAKKEAAENNNTEANNEQTEAAKANQTAADGQKTENTKKITVFRYVHL